MAVMSGLPTGDRKLGQARPACTFDGVLVGLRMLNETLVAGSP